ncbi:unnamed protein product, partial [Meganyctiphanes norvegica]
EVVRLSTSNSSIRDGKGNSSNGHSVNHNRNHETNWHNWYEDLITQHPNEISQDFNFTLISEILRNLDNHRGARLYMPHVMTNQDDPPRASRRDDQVPVDVQPTSLWDYLYDFIYNEEPQTSQDIPNQQQQEVVTEKNSVSSPCENVQGNINYWDSNASPLSVLVVGGGIAGLASLKTLIRLGYQDAVLLEAQHRLGGGVNTVRHERWVVEEGPSKIRGGGDNPMFLIAKELEEIMEHPPNHRWNKVAVDNDGNVLTEGAVVR